jgi:hypothetical protein
VRKSIKHDYTIWGRVIAKKMIYVTLLGGEAVCDRIGCTDNLIREHETYTQIKLENKLFFYFLLKIMKINLW